MPFERNLQAAKTFLLLELCIAISKGVEWLGFNCSKGKVLYLNLEIRDSLCVHRICDICDALNITDIPSGSFGVWHLRGYDVQLEAFVPELITEARQGRYDAIVIDPIYKITAGDENSAADMGRFCRELDRICQETNCAVIFAHHHSKGSQTGKRSVDRSSGSGVFGRDPDAILDLIELDTTNPLPAGTIAAFSVEATLRDFPPVAPITCRFDFPIHIIDENLRCYVKTAGKADSSAPAGRAQRKKELDKAFDACAKKSTPVTVTDLARYLDLSDRSIINRIKENIESYDMINGTVRKII